MQLEQKQSTAGQKSRKMSSASVVLIFSLLGVLHGIVEAREAPGDHDADCRTGLNEPHHAFPNEWRVLVDNYDYRNLYGIFPGLPAWRAQDFDGDFRQWEQVFGGVCTQSLYSCSYTGGVQENWLFSQFINYEDANEIFFNVSYRFTQCRDNSRCSNDFVTMYRYDADGPRSESDRTDTENYQPLLGDELSSRLQQPPRPSTNVRETLSLVRPEPRTRGFYLGFRDTGTCGQVNRIIVYYTICHARQNELVLYPQVGSPPEGGPDAIHQAQCVDNAHNVTSLAMKAFSENGTCMDVVPGGARCECNAGYEIAANRRSCRACPPGTFRALGLSNTCQTCPANTLTDVEAAPECGCIAGFFRRNTPGQEEGPEKDCSAPPGPVSNLKVTEADDKSITITWNKPNINTGRSDLYYEILISATNEGTVTVVESFFEDSRSSVAYTIAGLRAFTNYTISVVTHNGVSGQDPDNEDRRTVEVKGGTTEGVPGVPVLNRLCTVIIWRPPVEPAGVIVRYDVRFPDGITSYGPDDNFHITTATQREMNALVEIRAVNSFASSQWTEPLPIDCVNNMGCPTMAPTTMPTTSTPTTPTTSTPTTPTTSTPTTPTPTTSTPTTPTPTSASVSPPDTDGAMDGTPCEALTAPAQGSVSEMAGEAQYSCDDGHSLIGDATRQCLSDGTWTGSAPTCVLTCKLRPLHFMFKGELLLNNSQIQVQDLGENEDALLAVTEFEDCCRTERIGEFFYPNGERVGVNANGQPFYRNRGTQLLRLNRRNGDPVLAIDQETASLLGRFSCEILDGCGENAYLYIDIVS